MPTDIKQANAATAKHFISEFRNGLTSRLEKSHQAPESFARVYYQHVIRQWIDALDKIEPNWVNGINIAAYGKLISIKKQLYAATGLQPPLAVHPTHMDKKIILMSYSPLINLIGYLIEKLQHFVQQFPELKIATKNITKFCQRAINTYKKHYKHLRHTHYKLKAFLEANRQVELLTQSPNEINNKYEQLEKVEHILNFLESKNFILGINITTRLPGDTLKFKQMREASYIPLIKNYFGTEAEAVIALVLQPPKPITRSILPAVTKLVLQAETILTNFPAAQERRSVADDLQSRLDAVCVRYNINTTPWIDLSLFNQSRGWQPLDHWTLDTLKLLSKLYWEIAQHTSRPVGETWIREFVHTLQQLTLALTPSLSMDSKATIVMTQAYNLNRLIDDRRLRHTELTPFITALQEKIVYSEESQSILWQLIPSNIYASVSEETGDVNFIPQDTLSDMTHRLTCFLLLIISITPRHREGPERQARINTYAHQFFGQVLSLSFVQADRPYNIRRKHLFQQSENFQLMLLRLCGLTHSDLRDWFFEKVLSPLSPQHLRQQLPEQPERPRAFTVPDIEPTEQANQQRDRSRSLLSRAAHKVEKRLRPKQTGLNDNHDELNTGRRRPSEANRPLTRAPKLSGMFSLRKRKVAAAQRNTEEQTNGHQLALPILGHEG